MTWFEPLQNPPASPGAAVRSAARSGSNWVSNEPV